MRLLFFFFILSIQAQFLYSGESEKETYDDELVIDLSRPVILHPTLIIPPNPLSSSEIAKKHLIECTNIFTSDLEKSGMIACIRSEKEKQIQQYCQENWPNISLNQIQNGSIRYLILCTIDKKEFSTHLISLPDGRIKNFSPISLTGNISIDRSRIHQLSDFLLETLFSRKGIASTKILYSKRYTQRTKQANAKESQLVSTIAEIYLADYDGGNEKKITNLGTVSVTPQWIPKKENESPSFLFVSYLIGQPKIYIASLKEQKIIRLTPMRGNQLTPAVSFDGKRVAFCSDILGSSDLYMVSFHSLLGELSKPRQIYKTPFCTTGCPSFSPDGTSIAFVSNKDGSPKIYTIPIPKESTKLKEIKATLITKKWRENSPPAWSPDGKKIAYSAKSSAKERQIWIYDFDQEREYPITSGAGSKENPSWAPDSFHLAYQGMDEQGKWDIYIIDLNQKKPVKITSGSGDNQFPAWEVR